MNRPTVEDERAAMLLKLSAVADHSTDANEDYSRLLMRLLSYSPQGEGGL